MSYDTATILGRAGPPGREHFPVSMLHDRATGKLVLVSSSPTGPARSPAPMCLQCAVDMNRAGDRFVCPQCGSTSHGVASP